MTLLCVCRFSQIVHMPVVCNDRCLCIRLQKNCGFPQLQFFKDVPVVVQRPIPMVLATTETHQLRVDTVVDAPICRSCRFPSRGAEACLMVQTVRRTIAIPQLHVYKVVDELIMQVCRSSKSRRGAEAVSHGLPDQSDSPVLLNTVIDVPVLQVVQVVVFPVVVRRQNPMVQTLLDHRDSPAAPRHGARCPCYAGRASSTGRHHPCRDAEADPHGLVDHGDSAVAPRRGGRCPVGRWCEFHRCRRGEDSCAPTVAPVEKLVACSS